MKNKKIIFRMIIVFFFGAIFSSIINAESDFGHVDTFPYECLDYVALGMDTTDSLKNPEKKVPVIVIDTITITKEDWENYFKFEKFDKQIWKEKFLNDSKYWNEKENKVDQFSEEKKAKEIFYWDVVEKDYRLYPNKRPEILTSYNDKCRSLKVVYSQKRDSLCKVYYRKRDSLTSDYLDKIELKVKELGLSKTKVKIMSDYLGYK